MMMTNATADIYEVLVPLPLPRRFDYNSGGHTLLPGQLVTVPFGQKQLTGMVMGHGSGNFAAPKLKPITDTLPLPPVTEALRNFLQWSAAYTMTAPGLLLKMTLAGTQVPAPPTSGKGWQRTELPPPPCKAGSKSSHLLALFASPDSIITSETLSAAGLQTADATTLVKRGYLQQVAIAAAAAQPQPDFMQPQLSAAQQTAAQQLCDSFNQPRPILLQGVTGSGKTEVYCEAIAACLRQGKQALILLPEIALTTAMLARFTARFGCTPTIWHSDLPDKQRRANWWQIAEGEAKLIVGARSALFLPYPALGLIIIDEEHEAAYKQEEGVLYHARDLAVARAHHAQIPVILASATPSLETYVNAQQQRYGWVKLPERFGGARLPTIHRIDMRAENLPRTRFLSAPLLTALRETLQAGEQAMLFLNRRGYAPLTLCRHCGHRLQCPHCSAWLVQHKHHKQLQCHHCGTRTPVPQHCPACRAEDKFAPCGPGVERVAEEAATLLPEARIAIMSSDLLDSPQKISGLLAQVAAHAVDVLIGTQIMAKGYHFPNMTLVGIVDADLGLSGGDPRASERCYQLLQQVAGRTGRAEKPGRAYLQTYQPAHPVMQALAQGDQAAFMAAELAERTAYHLPPMRRLAALIISGADAAAAEALANRIAQCLPQNPRLQLLGPAPAPLALLRGRHRFRLLLNAEKSVNLQRLIAEALISLQIPKSLKLQIDIDPYSFF